MSHLPKEQHEQARSTLRAGWKLDADEGIRKLEQYASWLEREWPSAAASLREGLSEILDYQHLWILKAHLDEEDDEALAETRRSGSAATVAADFQLPAGHPRFSFRDQQQEGQSRPVRQLGS